MMIEKKANSRFVFMFVLALLLFMFLVYADVSSVNSISYGSEIVIEFDNTEDGYVNLERNTEIFNGITTPECFEIENCFEIEKEVCSDVISEECSENCNESCGEVLVNQTIEECSEEIVENCSIIEECNENCEEVCVDSIVENCSEECSEVYDNLTNSTELVCVEDCFNSTVEICEDNCSLDCLENEICLNETVSVCNETIEEKTEEVCSEVCSDSCVEGITEECSMEIVEECSMEIVCDEERGMIDVAAERDVLLNNYTTQFIFGNRTETSKFGARLDAPILYFNFNEQAVRNETTFGGYNGSTTHGRYIIDNSIYHHHGIMSGVNGSYWVEGIVNQSLAMDGGNDHLDTNTLHNETNISISVWFWKNATGGYILSSGRKHGSYTNTGINAYISGDIIYTSIDTAYDNGAEVVEYTNTSIDILKAIAGNVKEWAGNWDAVWDNILLRAKMKETLVGIGDSSLLEAKFVILCNDMFHKFSDKIVSEVGHLDSDKIFFEWNEWLKKEVKKRSMNDD